MHTQHLSFAVHTDLIQLAGAISLEELGGPAVPFTAGRRSSKVYPPEGRLPTAAKSVLSHSVVAASMSMANTSSKQ
jgi:catalase (peroxidase I)